MATRSALAVQSGQTIRAIYCHWDGYPSHQLPILQGRYNNLAAALALITPGDLSALETETGWDRQPLQQSRPLYYHERGDANISPRSFANRDDLTAWADGCGCEHVYLYQPRKGWHHAPVARQPIGAGIMPGVDPAQW
jgi:hypothetical protein